MKEYLRTDIVVHRNSFAIKKRYKMIGTVLCRICSFRPCIVALIIHKKYFLRKSEEIFGEGGGRLDYNIFLSRNH